MSGTKTARSAVRRKRSARQDQPLTLEEILQRDNVAPTEPIPAKIVEGLTRTSFVISSDAAEFDPRKHFTKVKGYQGAWELSATEYGIRQGLRVQSMERMTPRLVARAVRSSASAEPSRPAWHPYVYHPKTIAAGVTTEARSLRRKNGATVFAQTIFNRDDREMFLPDGYPWHCVGAVVINGVNQGTGTLVGSRAVLCSAHMIPWGDSARGVSIQFIPGFFSTASLTVPSVLRGANGRATSSFVTDARGYNVPGRVAWDIAVLRLADPLGTWLGTMGSRTYDDDWEDDPRWTLVGYPSEWGSQMELIRLPIPPYLVPVFTTIKSNATIPTRQFGISVEDDDSDAGALELEHHGDTSPGNSGGPLFG
ncbi:MAG TPA: hypothetical protein VHM25_02210, partial [Polyangiaceae bacterium]|nr:hypothetical protein [Polyangiaceae bacterium]